MTDSGLEILECKGCWGDFTNGDIDNRGYCFGCGYEADAKADNKTGGEDE